MDCKTTQKIILTSYIDGRISDKEQTLLDAHTKTCAGCRASLEEAKGLFIEPFKTLHHEEVPANLWNKIQGALEKESKPSWLERINEALKSFWLSFTSPAPLAAFSLSLLIVTLVAGGYYQKSVHLAKEKNTRTFLVAMVTESSDETQTDPDYGSQIEQYFL